MKPDPDNLNEKRAASAQAALEAFNRTDCAAGGEDILADLLCNLMHWTDRHPECAPNGFQAELERAQRNYEAETTE